MTPEAESKSEKKQPIFLNPWLVGAIALVLYLVTLNHWVTRSSLPVVAQITGWDWHPGTMVWRASPGFPLLQVLTLPVRLFPAAWQPVCLNLYSAVCAALTLSLLARSIRLLPHDRTKEQRQRHLGENATLPVRAAFLPPLLAVLALGLQITFWENAITATGEMLNLLIFAFLIFSLLQYRVTKNEKWFTFFALAYGVGLTNCWALIGYFPFFLASIVWIRGLSFFNIKFLFRLTVWGALGLLLYLLIPAMSAISNGDNFWTALYDQLAHQKFILSSIPRWVAFILGLPTWLALIFIAIRWPSFEGDMNQAGELLTSFFFRFLHVVLFIAGLWLFLDIKYSPRELESRITFLSFYYIAALNVGYLGGYILLIFGEAPVNVWRRQPAFFKLLNPLALGLAAVALLALPSALVYRNVANIKKTNSPALREFFTEVAKALPPKPALILSDDRFWLFLTRAAGHSLGRPDQDIMLDTTALPHREYLHYLRQRHAEFQQALPDAKFLPPVLDTEADLLNFVTQVSRHYPAYYLQPSFGFYYEQFYAIPRGPIFELKEYPPGHLQPPPLTPSDIAVNQDFWQRIRQSSLSQNHQATNDWSDPVMVSLYLSRALNNWGVELQKSGHLKEAGLQFAEAYRLNAQNPLAQINQKYNTRLVAGNAEPLDTAETLAPFGNPVSLMLSEGPCEEPDIISLFANYMAEGGNLRQAALLFLRRLQLLPNDPVAELGLARCYLDLNLPDETLKLVKALRAQSPGENFIVSHTEAIAYLRKNDYPKAEQIIETAHRSGTNDIYQLNTLFIFYRAAAMNAAQTGRTNQARACYQKAFATINQLIGLLDSPAHSSLNTSEVPDALLHRAELEMQTGVFTNAISSFTEVINREPANRVALFNLAACQVELQKFDEARQTYKSLLKNTGKESFDVYYGLAHIAELTHDKKEAMSNFKLYLKYAPTYTMEYATVVHRMKELQQGG